MRISIKSALVGATALAVAGGLMVLGAGAASAVTITPPPWQPGGTGSIAHDPNNIGSLSFFDVNGNQIAGGSIDAPIAPYIAASGANAPSDLANLDFATPTAAPPASWSNAPVSSSYSYPAAGLPGSLAGNTNAVVGPLSSTEGLLRNQVGGAANTQTTNPDEANVYEVRVKTTDPTSTKYFSADVLVNATTSPVTDTYEGGTYTVPAGSWVQVFPVLPAAIATTTNLVVTPTGSATAGQTVTLTAGVTAASGPVPNTGSVSFFDGPNQLGATQPWTGTAASVQVTTSTLSTATHTLTAVYTPAGLTWSTSTGTVSNYVVGLTPTHTALTITTAGPYTTGEAINLSATVTESTVPGSMVFTDNGTALTGTAANTGGVYTLSGAVLPSGAVNQTILATFTPSDGTHAVSTSSQTIQVTAPTVGACASEPVTAGGPSCTDTQYIQANVPVGTLFITTPYTQAAPLVFQHDLQLIVGPDGHLEYNQNAPFQNIQVADTRAGNLGWTLTAVSSDLTDGHTNANSKINSQNVGLTSVTGTTSAGFVGTVVTTDNFAADPAVAPGAGLGAVGQQGLGINAHTVAVAAVGDTPGTWTANGILTISAPTSTEAGTYTGTILFTVG
jgi:hypothetical protein